MTPPLIFNALLGLLMTLAIPASLTAFVIAGMKLRNEGGVNYMASGGFLKWLFWGAFMLTLPGLGIWLVNESVPGASGLISNGISTAYTSSINTVATAFVNDILIGHIVPVVAAALVFKALLDQSQGVNPLGSIVAASALVGSVMRRVSVERHRTRTTMESTRGLLNVEIETVTTMTVTADWDDDEPLEGWSNAFDEAPFVPALKRLPKRSR